MKVNIKNIYISQGHNYFGRYGKGSLNYSIIEKSSVELHAAKGIVGDRFYDYEPDYKGQITFFDWQVYLAVSEEFSEHEFTPQSFRRNIILDGIDLNCLIGKRFTINGVEFVGMCECSPCFWMDEACGEGTHQSLIGRGGLRARIINDGELSVGNETLNILGEVEGIE